MLDLIINNLSETIVIALAGIVTFLFTTIRNKIKKFIDEKQIEKIIDDVVRYVNQSHDVLSNDDKFKIAQKEIMDWLETEGLRITQIKLKVLIESAVNRLK